ncbi:LamG-like jellyroll fold domain-containing protein [Haloferula sp. A504]|uniref:LamG-like jellyroll fold domain-containing protein n=1 Tax=Haloferula sp. A504 TaxID=3373601 RepID=UPI0031C6F01B|nr:hypothetical protein [Verrucomicrobiaceae bacterium E54]
MKLSGASFLHRLQYVGLGAMALLSPIAGAVDILINSGDGTIRDENGLDHDFGESLHAINRRGDQTLEVVIRGDLHLAAGDSLRGVGPYPVEIRVGNDVRIDPGATVNFSAIDSEPGAGGGAGVSGGRGGRGGTGGKGGLGGFLGIGGLGGASVPVLQSPVKVTTPGLPAARGLSGFDGTAGSSGSAGGEGRRGRAGFNARGSGGGVGGDAGSPEAPARPGGTGGDAGELAGYPPKIWFQGEAIRVFFFGEASRDEETFRNLFFNGNDGVDGVSAEDEPPAANGAGSDGDSGVNSGDDWVLSGGNAGGSGAGGGGGPGGPGGGGGGSGAGGQGEWIEPIPTSLFGIIGAGVKSLKDLVQHYLDRKKEKDETDTKKFPSIELGATGGMGGFGGRGGDGGKGGHGGTGGASGAGGGALRLVAGGTIFFDGAIQANGGDGATGAAGTTENSLPPRGLGLEGLDPAPGVSVGSAISFALGNTPNAGRGGDGGDGGSGGLGGTGSPGGKGAGGAGGTVIIEGTQVKGSGSIGLLGGNQDDVETIGGGGRLFIGTNQVTPGTPAGEFADEPGEFQVTPAVVGSTTREGTMAANPYLRGSPLTPTIPGLIGGAEAFGLISDPAAPSDAFEADQFTVMLPPPGGGAKESKTLKQWAEDYAAVDPENEQGAVVAAVRLDEAPDLIATELGLSVDFPGYDWVFVFNPRSSELVDVRFGLNEVVLPLTPSETTPKHAATLREGGYLNDPDFGGAGDVINGQFVAGQFDVFVILVPEDDSARGLNLAMSATAVPNGGGSPVVYSKEIEQFANDDLMVITFDPDIPVYQATWADPTSSGNWSNAGNWNVTLDGGGSFNDYPNNSTVEAYNVSIGPGLLLDVDQDVSVTIDRLEIGDDTRLFIQDGRSLEIEKFYVREQAGVITNDGLIRLLGNTAPTELRFTGDGQVLTGSGTLSTTASSFNVISGDSLLQESGHTILGHGQLGANQLEIVNRGTILSGPADPRSPLTIDPAGDGDRSLPSFILEGADAKLQVSGWPFASPGLSSELVLKDGYFRIDPASTFGFEPAGQIDEQILTLDRSRLEREDAAFIDSQPVVGDAIALAADLPQRTIRIIGDPVATDDEVVLTRANLRTTGGGYLEINDVDLRLDGSSIKLQETGQNGYGFAPSTVARATVDNGGVFGGLLTYDRSDLQPGDLLGLLPCDIDQASLELDNPVTGNLLADDYLQYQYLLRLQGANVRLGDLRIDGCYRFDPFLEQKRLLAGDNVYEFVESRDLLTVDSHADSLTLSGVIDHNGLLLAYFDTTELLLDGNVELIGEGGWKFRMTNESDPRLMHVTRFKGVPDLPVDERETLTIGAGQVMHRAGFDSDGLFVENEGLLLRASVSYDDNSIPGTGDPGYAAAVEAVKAQPIFSNRGVIQPDGIFGGGTMDNQGGVIALGGAIGASSLSEDIDTRMENLRIEGGLVSPGLHYRDTDRDYLAGSKPARVVMTNVDFVDVRFESELFVPRSAESFFDLLINGSFDGELNAGAGAFDVRTGGTGILLENVTLGTHVASGRIAVAGKLVIEEGVAVMLQQLDLIDDDYEIEFPDESDYEGPDDPRSSLALSGLWGNPGSRFTVPAGLDFFASGAIGQDRVVLELEEGALVKPIPDFLGGGITLNPPGDMNAAAPGLVNRGTITAYDSYEFVDDFGTITGYDTEIDLNLIGGFYDNTDGIIEFGSILPGQISDARIVGGVLRGRVPGTVVNISNSVLRDVRVENITFVGDYTIEEGRYLNDDADAETITGDVTFAGMTRLERSASWTSTTGYDFVFDRGPDFGGNPADAISIGADVRVQFASATPEVFALSNLRNAGLIETPHAFEITSPTFTGSQTLGSDEQIFFDPESVSLVSLEELGELGAGETLAPESSGKIENTGTIESAGTIRIDSTALDNRTGEIIANSSLRIIDSIVENEGGVLASPNPNEAGGERIEIYSSVINGGVLATHPDNTAKAGTIELLGQHPDGPAFGGANRTAIVDVEMSAEFLSIGNGATLWCLGSVTGPSFVDAFGAIRVTGTFEAVSIEPGDWDLEMDGGTLLASATTSGTVSGSGTIEDLNLDSGSVIRPVLRGVNDHDHLDITTGFYSEAVVEPVLADGFRPSYGDVFTILTAPDSIFDAEGMSGSRVFMAGGGSFAVYFGDEYMTNSGDLFPNPHDPASIVLADYQGPTPIHYVAQGSAGLGDGTSWEDAFPDLQAAIAIAQPGEEIWVAAGIYVPGTQRSDSFVLNPGVRIYGGFPAGGGRWSSRNPDPASNGTVLSGEIGAATISDNCHHIIDARSADLDSLLDGFTLTGGNADASGGDSLGAGITVGRRSPSFSNLLIKENRAKYGGAYHSNVNLGLAMYLDFDENPASNGTVVADRSGNGRSATLVNNNGTANKSVAGPVGRALNFDGNDRVNGSAFDISNTFTIALWVNPTTTSNAQAFIGKHDSNGGNQVLFGFYDSGYHFRIRGDAHTAGTPTTGWQHLAVVGRDLGNGTTDVTVYRNGVVIWNHIILATVGNVGGGLGWAIGQEYDTGGPVTSDFLTGQLDEISIWNGNLSAVEVADLYQQTRRADDLSADANGSVTFTNVSFVDNVSDIAGGSGGAVYLTNGASPAFINCLFAGNSAPQGGAVRGFNSDPQFINCTFAANNSPIGSAIYGDASTNPLMRNCIVWGNTGGIVLDTDPLDAGSLNNLIEGGYAPLPGAVVSTEDPQFVAADDFRLMPGSPALELGDAASNPSEFDLAGKVRIQGTAIDLGAYEGALMTFATLHPLLDPALDANGNGRSNFEDYAAGFDPTAAFDVTLHSASLLRSDGSWFFTHPVRLTGEDVVISYESSSTLSGFTPMVEGVDYEVIGSVPIDGTREEVVIRLLDEQLGAQRKFFRRRFVGAP